MRVLAEDKGEQDFCFYRGISNTVGNLWETRNTPSDQWHPVDLTNWACTFEMYLPGEYTPVYSRACDAHGIDGKAATYIPADAFTDNVWATRKTGTWRTIAKNGNIVELLGSGYWHLD